jgi:hypothetical protein
MTRGLSRRGAMSVIVAAQLLFLAAIVAPQELNMALDRGPAVELEIIQARPFKDPFRGAYVSGQSSLDLDGRAVVLPADGLRPGDRVLVAFAVEPNRRPRVVGVERGRRAAPFTKTSFTIPGRVVDGSDRNHDRPTARVGDPPVAIELDLPRTISVDESAVARLAGPGLVRASLHAGFLGHRYFSDVRLTGHAWSADARFVYDDARARLVVFSPRAPLENPIAGDASVRSDVFVFDAAGKEVAAGTTEGRVIDTAAEPDGGVLALVSDKRWSQDASLARIGDDGRIVQRSAPVTLDRVLGLDAASGSMWLLAGTDSARRAPPHFIQRASFAGPREPRLGPFDSIPRTVLSVGDDVWVVETERHRITRFDAASGRTAREYRDLNAPVDVAAGAGSIYVIEASRTQLTRLAEDGRVLWRIPRFRGLTWVVPEPGTGGGWISAGTFEGAAAGVLRFGPDGAISRLAAASPTAAGDWPPWLAPDVRRRLGADAVRSRDGRLFILEPGGAIVILSADGATATRVVGFRLPAEQRLRR